MATNEFNATKPETAFSEFSWNNEGADRATISSGPAIRFSDKIRNHATGLGVILELIEHDLILKNPRVLNDYQIGALMRLAIQSAHDLNAESEGFSEWVERHLSADPASDLH